MNTPHRTRILRYLSSCTEPASALDIKEYLRPIGSQATAHNSALSKLVECGLVRRYGNTKRSYLYVSTINEVAFAQRDALARALHDVVHECIDERSHMATPQQAALCRAKALLVEIKG